MQLPFPLAGALAATFFGGVGCLLFDLAAILVSGFDGL
jgi:hypothetical protein